MKKAILLLPLLACSTPAKPPLAIPLGVQSAPTGQFFRVIPPQAAKARQ